MRSVSHWLAAASVVVVVEAAVSCSSSGGMGPGSADPATQLAFTRQPAIPSPGSPMIVGVSVEDAAGHTVSTATTSVTLAIGANPNGGTLFGTATERAVNGVATFAVSIDNPGNAYTLVATATGGSLTGATSAPFNVVVPLGEIVSAGANHTCALTFPGDAAYCWGINGDGELGTGTTTNSAVPVAVGGGGGFATVSAGDGFTCGVTNAAAAVTVCWGVNGSGQLGDGTTTSRTTPVVVQAPGNVTLAGVTSAGGSHTCVAEGPSFSYCWGGNFFGELGDGTTTNRTTPVTVSYGLVPGFATISAGLFHTCAMLPAGAAYCWGANGNGQLGIGSTTNKATPTAVSGGLTFIMVSAGGSHTCGVTNHGTVYCWGDNSFGQLGTGTTTSSTTPVAVASNISFAAVSAGTGFTCALTYAELAYCWGANSSGQLGNGTVMNSTTPAAVSGGLAFAGVSAGGSHVCAPVIAGPVYCWGDNRYGQLGIGTTTNSPVPVKVFGQP